MFSKVRLPLANGAVHSIAATCGAATFTCLRSRIYMEPTLTVDADQAALERNLEVERAQTRAQLQRHLEPRWLTLGGVLGVATGFFLKKTLRLAMFFCGACFVGLQSLAYLGYLTIDWRWVDRKFSRMVYGAADKAEQVSFTEFKRKAVKMFDILTFNFPFSAAFFSGFTIGTQI